MKLELWHYKNVKISVSRTELCTEAIQRDILTTSATCIHLAIPFSW